jgi:hypothetical protein
MAREKRYAIITPYYREDVDVLRRCTDSVKRQSVKVDHFLIADGHPQAWLDHEPVRHLKLDRPHGDNGDTPRGLGALLAVAEEYDGIGLLDADNWFDPDHVECCLKATREANETHCDFVIARRRIRRPDETIMYVGEERGHVDTSCFFFLRGAFHVLPTWATLPKPLSPGCDRYFYAMLQKYPFRYARVKKPTVNFVTQYEVHYREAGEQPPANSKPYENYTIQPWLDTLTPRELEIARRLSGVELQQSHGQGAAASPTRNALCPCGSGKKFKRCHGAAVG